MLSGYGPYTVADLAAAYAGGGSISTGGLPGRPADDRRGGQHGAGDRSGGPTPPGAWQDAGSGYYCVDLQSISTDADTVAVQLKDGFMASPIASSATPAGGGLPKAR